MESLLYEDSLTGGISQEKFEQQAKKKIMENKSGYYVIVQLNLEKFKLINTLFGHAAGNDVLKYIHNFMSNELGEGELISRFNSDRFCLLLLNSPMLLSRLQKICININSFNNSSKSKYYLDFDAGACIIDNIFADVDILYEQANLARTHGTKKKFAHFSCAFYDDLEKGVLLREKEIENRMKEALQSGEFQMYLQPKFSLSNDKISGAEALVRWLDPKKGIVFPNEFIPLFERNGFIVDLDLYMFTQACLLLQSWYDKGAMLVPISVNLSRVHFLHPNFMESYKMIFENFTFPPKFIEFELTESIVFNNFDLLSNVIDQIHFMGFECSLDDFGSGYSSLNLLKDLPVDTLKLDRAFFHTNSLNDTKTRYVIENVINLAKKLDMKTVSEGIETFSQVDYLRSVQCEMVQGYVFAKPMPVNELEALLYGKNSDS